MSHRPAELRSIALHELVAERIREDDAIVVRAATRVDSWVEDGGPVAPEWAARWQELLRGPREELLAALVVDTEEMRDLRQVTPFAGVVPERERQRIVREVGRHAS